MPALALPADPVAVVTATFPDVVRGAQAYATLLRQEMRGQDPAAVLVMLREELPVEFSRLGLSPAQATQLIALATQVRDQAAELETLVLLAGVVATLDDVLTPLYGAR